jgi:hypothetical protein
MSSLPLNAASFLPAELANIATAFPIKPQIEKKAAVLKHIARSERLFAVRPASQLEVRPRPEMLFTGISELDAMTGGIPRGCLTEICGSASSGKTSVLLAVMASASRREESCALIDARDSFDPSSGAAAGIDFNKLLWVRSGKRSSVVRRPSSAKRGESGYLKLNLQKDFGGTGVPARALRNSRGNYSEHRLDQVLKTTDLILQSGGFGLVALDLAGIPEKFGRRIPLASWFRFQRAVEHTKTALLVISEFACSQTCATLAIKLCSKPSAISHQSPGKPSHAQVLEGMSLEVEILRARLERKPVQSETAVFRTQAVRAG